MKLVWLFIGLVVAGVAGVIYAWPAGLEQSTGSSQDYGAAYFNAKDLVDASDLIVIAEFLDEEEERVEIQHPVTGPTGVLRDDLLRRYKVYETLKGNVGASSEVVVWNSSGLDDRSQGRLTQAFELTEAVKGRLYVLFLAQSERDGEPFWGQTGDPEKGVLDGGNIRLLSTNRYKEAARENGYAVMQGEGAPFSLTVAELRDLTGKAAPPAPTLSPATPAGGSIVSPTPSTSTTPALTP